MANTKKRNAGRMEGGITHLDVVQKTSLGQRKYDTIQGGKEILEALKSTGVKTVKQYNGALEATLNMTITSSMKIILRVHFMHHGNRAGER